MEPATTSSFNGLRAVPEPVVGTEVRRSAAISASEVCFRGCVRFSGYVAVASAVSRVGRQRFRSENGLLGKSLGRPTVTFSFGVFSVCAAFCRSCGRP